MRYFCTYFDQHYLARGLALYQSLKRHCPAFQLWMLCLDQASYTTLAQLSLANVHLISLEEFERGDEALLTAKQNRSLVEYYFTCTPSLPLFVLNHWPEVGSITYLDADLFFFADPTPVYAEIADNSIALIRHRFPPHLKRLEQWGIYNVGLLFLRRDEHALACLCWWRERCLEWCYDRVERDRFADQKYLDQWPHLFSNVVVLQHKGANLAPWNLDNYDIHEEGAGVWVDEQPLIFYHFQGLKQITKWLYDPNLATYNVRLTRILRRSIYGPYLQTLLEAPKCGLPQSRNGIRYRQLAKPKWRQYASKVKRSLQVGEGIFTQKYLFLSRRTPGLKVPNARSAK